MNAAPNQATTPPPTELEFASFYVGNQLVGVNILDVEEINRHFDLTRVPHAPPYVRGVVNLRGEVVTIIDLRTILELPPTEIDKATRNVIVNFHDERIGLVVDRVGDVITVSPQEIDTPPANFNDGTAQFFDGVYKLDEELLLLLNLGAALRVEPVRHR